MNKDIEELGNVGKNIDAVREKLNEVIRHLNGRTTPTENKDIEKGWCCADCNDMQGDQTCENPACACHHTKDIEEWERQLEDLALYSGDEKRVKELIRSLRHTWLQQEIEVLESIVNSEAYKQMAGESWTQLDEDGVMVGCSRQAIEEVNKEILGVVDNLKIRLSSSEVLD